MLWRALFNRLGPRVARHPGLALIYRTLRDAWRIQHEKPVATAYGFRLIGADGMQSGAYEPHETAWFKACLEQVDVCVDVGANIGLYACLARAQGVHTIAVEPFPQNLRRLYANLNENGWRDVEVYPLGLGSQPGLAALFGAGTGASLIPGWSGAPNWQASTISLATLDILLGDRFAAKRMLIKIDVEGAEYEVLLGAQRTLDKAPHPTWMVEICLAEHHPAGLNPHYAATFEMFWRRGYQAHSLGPEQRVVSRADVERTLSAPRGDGLGAVNFVFSATP